MIVTTLNALKRRLYDRVTSKSVNNRNILSKNNHITPTAKTINCGIHRRSSVWNRVEQTLTGDNLFI